MVTNILVLEEDQLLDHSKISFVITTWTLLIVWDLSSSYNFRYIDILRKGKPKFQWDATAAEHFIEYRFVCLQSS